MPTTTLLRRGIVAIALLSPLAILAMAADKPESAAKDGAKDNQRSSETKDAKETKEAKIEPEYHIVRAYLRVHAVAPSIATAGDSKIDLAEFEFYKRNLAMLVRTPVVINKALDDKKIVDLPLVKQHSAELVEWLTDQIQVKFPGNAELMTIEMAGEDRNQMRKIVDAVLIALKDEILDRDRYDRLVRRDTLEKKLRALKQSQLDKRRQLYELAQQIGTSDAEPAKVRYRMATDELEGLMKSRRDLQRRIAEFSLKLELAKHNAKDGEKSEGAIGKIETERAILVAQSDQLSKSIDAQAESIQKLDRFNGDADMLREEIDGLKPVIAELLATITRWNVELDAPPRVSIMSAAE